MDEKLTSASSGGGSLANYLMAAAGGFAQSLPSDTGNNFNNNNNNNDAVGGGGGGIIPPKIAVLLEDAKLAAVAVAGGGNSNDDLTIYLEDINKMYESEQRAEWPAKIVEWLRISKLLVGCILLFGGCFGNFVTFAVFRRKALRPYATSFLLGVLALSNVVVLVLGLLPKMIEYEMKADIMRTSIPFFCQIQVFLLYTFLHFTSWILVLVTFERFLSVWFPQRSLTLCTVRNTKIVASLLLFVQVSYNSQLLVTMEAQEVDRLGGPLPSTFKAAIKHQPSNTNETRTAALPTAELVCDSKLEYTDFHDRIWPVIHIAMFCFIPFLFMVILNGLIAGRLALLTNDLVLTPTPSLTMAQTQGRILSGMTMTMFACSLSFFAFTLPVSLYIVIRRQMPEEEARRNMAFYVMWTVLNLMQYVNNAAGFFYCLFGNLFRRELVKMWRSARDCFGDCLCCCDTKRRRDEIDGRQHTGLMLLKQHQRNLGPIYVGNAGAAAATHGQTGFNGQNSAGEREVLLITENNTPNIATRNNNKTNSLKSAKNCRILLVGDSEASVAQTLTPQQTETTNTPSNCHKSLNSLNLRPEHSRLLEEFGPSC